MRGLMNAHVLCVPCVACCLACQTLDRLKTSTAEEAFNKNGLSQRTIRMLKDKFPDLEVRVCVGGGGGCQDPRGQDPGGQALLILLFYCF